MTRSEILRLAKNRMIMGNKKHGKFDPNADTRDHFWEMIEELLDVVNYAIMDIQKLEVLRNKRNKLNGEKNKN